MDFRPFVREHLRAQAIARESEIVEELAQHLEDVYREARDSGLDDAEAFTRAAETLPAAADDLAGALQAASRTPPDRIADRVRAALDEPVGSPGGAFAVLTDLQRDCRCAARALIREPGFAAAVVITMALGIGGTSTIFSAVDAVLLKSVAVAEPLHVVSVYTVWAARATTNPNGGDQLGDSSYPDYVDLRDSGVLNGLAAFAGIGVSLDSNGVTEQIDAEIVSGNYFDVLGVPASVGRTFMSDEDRIGSPVRVVVLSHPMWQQRLGGDPGIVGQSISLNGNGYTVIGVAPRGFTGTTLGGRPEVWVPMGLQNELRPPSPALRHRLGGASLLGARDVRWLSMVGRLNDGVSFANTVSALDLIGRRLAAAHPESNRDLSAIALPLGEGPGVRTTARPILALLTAAVTLVLMIACANVASLLLARAVTRRREVAIRIAIGAGRGQLIRQWLTEAVILGVLGAAGGLMLAGWGAPIIYGFGIPQGVALDMNPRVLAFTLAIGVATGLAFGLAPVLQLLRADTISALRDEGGALSTGAASTRVRSAFVVVQLALSLILLIGAGLFIRTLQQAYAVDLGYPVDRVLVAEIDPDDSYSPEAAQALYVQLVDRLNVLPGVVSAAAARVTVLSGSARTVPVSIDGRPPRPDRSNVIPVRANVVSEGYLETMEIPLLRGRGFRSSDVQASPQVAIVSRSLADRLWPKSDPIGQHFLSLSRLEVVGVVPDTVYVRATERSPRPFFYLPLNQNYESVVSLHLRTEDEPLAILPAVRQVIRDIDPRLAVMRPRRLVDELDRSMTGQRTMALLVGALSGIALLLAAVGLYSVMAYSTRQRTSEIGLRLALGATPGSVLNLIVTRGARLVATGVVLGLAGAFAGAQYVRSLLFGVEPTDPLTWLTVLAVLALVALIACVLPARRAMRIDPTLALRGL